MPKVQEHGARFNKALLKNGLPTAISNLLNI
jgi:hypothetical protein